MAAKRGALIVMEGCDRSGKTTQCKRLGNICWHHGENRPQLILQTFKTPHHQCNHYRQPVVKFNS